MRFFTFLCVLLIMGLFISATPIFAGDPWIITSPVNVVEPMDIEDVIVTDGGSLIVTGVQEPGFRLSGNLIVSGSGSVEFRDSVVQVLSTYHSQYTMLVAGQGTLTIDHCDYRVPNGVQHGIMVVQNGHVGIQDSNFGGMQLVAGGQATLTASRLNGWFECIIQDEAWMELVDIPSTQEAGGLWVWPVFMPGSRAIYSPPMPGLISSYSFPPVGSSGVNQSFQITRCRVKLWPMLVREGSDLTISDVADENWVVVGLLLPNPVTVSGLVNGKNYVDETFGLLDRTLHLKNAFIDTWNLYPVENAKVTVLNSIIGEILADGESVLTMENTTVNGAGGYFGASSRAVVEANACTFTCDVQASGDTSIRLRNSLLLPSPSDTTGEYTRLGAFERARLHLDRTSVSTIRSLGGQGAIVVTNITPPPDLPPSRSSVVQLNGYAAVFSLDSSMDLATWQLKAYKIGNSRGVLLGSGSTNVLGGFLGRWKTTKSKANYELLLIVKDKAGRTFTGRTPAP